MAAAKKRRGKRRGLRYSLRALKAQDRKGPPDDDLPLLRYMVNPPRRRGECADGCRPCPFVSCAYHLALDVTPEGALRFAHGHEPEDLEAMTQTCALDVADDGCRSVVEVAEMMGISRQQTAQLEATALRKLAAAMKQQSSPALLREQPVLKHRFAELASEVGFD